MIKIVAPTGVFKKDGETLALRWNDGSESAYKVFTLRLECPCAVCVNEWTGAKILDASRVAKDVKPLRIFSVGRYAMGVHWSDGHKTGIYSYEYLRKLDANRPA